MSPLNNSNPVQGHRDRLRSRFRIDPEALSPTEQLELLLTYAIPRINLETLSRDLLGRFHSIEGVLSASPEELKLVPGVGEQVILYLNLLERIVMKKVPVNQPFLPGDLQDMPKKSGSTREKRIFTDDETENSIKFLPAVCNYQSLEEYRDYLVEHLPYNSLSTRKRRASYILNRFFPEQSLQTPLAGFLKRSPSLVALQAVVFYSILKVEPLPRRVAEELIYPNLPLGFIRRSELVEFIKASQPDLLPASIEKAVIAITKLYKESGMAIGKEDRLYFHQQVCDIDGFLFLLLNEFPQPGMYKFDEVFQGPLQKWMLWDRDWMINQLYNLRDMGIISKISEIDTINQFSLGMNRMEALAHYYAIPDAGRKAIRDANPD